MDGGREFIESLNPRSAVAAWEIAPCLEFPDPRDGDSEVEAFETVAEAEEQADEALGPVFFGVYMRFGEDAIAAGALPVMHLRDFATHSDAAQFVRWINGTKEDSE